MYADSHAPPDVRLDLDEDTVQTISKLGRWMRITGTIQLALSGIALLFVGLGMACGMLEAPSAGIVVLIAMLIPTALAATYLLQALRIQTAGEQFDNLATELHPDYLELAFARLHTVFVVDVVIGSLWFVNMAMRLAGWL